MFNSIRTMAKLDKNRGNERSNPFAVLLPIVVDDRGNLEEIRIYDYTEGSLEGLTPRFLHLQQTKKGNDVWEDQIQTMNYWANDNPEWLYDEIGNLLKDESYINIEWTAGRQLSKIIGVEDGIEYLLFEYTYDENGLRTSKTDYDGKTTYYAYSDNGTLLSQYDGEYTIDFVYDNNSTPTAMVINGELIYYVTNVQGDVIGYADETGKLYSRQYYNAWGKPNGGWTTESNASSPRIASMATQVNPVLYRGYCYDYGMQYYYLQSRYYLPNVYRFINADKPEYALVGKDQYAGTNLYVYCNNNAVNNSDPNGEIAAKKVAQIIFGGIIGAVTQLIADAICIAAKVQKGVSSVGTYVAAIARGALDTVLKLKKGIYNVIIKAVIGSAIAQILNKIIDKKPFDIYKFSKDVIKAAVKYAIKNKIKAKINASVEKKIEEKVPRILQEIVKYAYNKMMHIVPKTLSYNALKTAFSTTASLIVKYAYGQLRKVI